MQDSHDPRRDRIHSDPVLGLLLRQAPRECGYRAFGRAVVDRVGIPRVARDRAAVHYTAAAPHMRQSEFGERDHAEDVCAEGPLDDGEVDFLEVGDEFLHGGVVDKDVELLEDQHVRVDRGLAVGFDGEVERKKVCFSAGGFDVGFCVLGVGFLGGEVDEAYVCAFAGPGFQRRVGRSWSVLGSLAS